MNNCRDIMSSLVVLNESKLNFNVSVDLRQFGKR